MAVVVAVSGLDTGTGGELVEGAATATSSGIISRELGDMVTELDIVALVIGSASSSMASNNCLDKKMGEVDSVVKALAVNAESAVLGVVGVKGDNESVESLQEELLLKGGVKEGKYDKRCPINLRLGAKVFL